MLEQYRVAAQRMVSEELINDAQFVARSLEAGIIHDPMFGTAMLWLKAFVLAEKVAADEYETGIAIPATWWQHLKQDHAPLWIRIRWPVRTRSLCQKIRFKRLHLYPDARIALPEDHFGKLVIYDEITPLGWRDADT